MKRKRAFTLIKPLVVIVAITITVGLLSFASASQTSTSGKFGGKKTSIKKLKRVDLTKIPSPQVLAGNENNHYRDPTAIYHDGIFRLFFTVNQPRDNKKYMVSFLGTTTSRDLVNWTPVKLLTPEDPALNYSSPGNIIRYNAEWIICFQTYPIGSLKGFGGDGTARLFIMRSKDLENWSEPELLKVKGPDVPRERMGRMIDPYLIKDKDEPGKWWCFYKQNGVSMSYSYDLLLCPDDQGPLLPDPLAGSRRDGAHVVQGPEKLETCCRGDHQAGVQGLGLGDGPSDRRIRPGSQGRSARRQVRDVLPWDRVQPSARTHRHLFAGDCVE
ncbi:MAG: hypothetical protein ACYSU5_15855 [Planctomycetota bacterium]